MIENQHIVGEKAMLDLGKEFAKNLLPGDIVFLIGDLGAGKTTLVRGLLSGLGYQGKVKSPTYTLVESYELENKQLHHFDLYRLNDSMELELMGGRDYFNPHAICLIEWPERAQDWLPQPGWLIKIDYRDANSRDVQIEHRGN